MAGAAPAYAASPPASSGLVVVAEPQTVEQMRFTFSNNSDVPMAVRFSVPIGGAPGPLVWGWSNYAFAWTWAADDVVDFQVVLAPGATEFADTWWSPGTTATQTQVPVFVDGVQVEAITIEAPFVVASARRAPSGAGRVAAPTITVDDLR